MHINITMSANMNTSIAMSLLSVNQFTFFLNYNRFKIIPSSLLNHILMESQSDQTLQSQSDRTL
ncbi:hypothetical protein HanXRQr2_Chr12g0525761 [Helianthus annuus]|uniref:Uncharacterized protein n=1 Tax=Helianthus annuus TaxID=4232 RepID=A0A9K3EP17_HELAN|nr:hypothetical protein HanXRQr2_Chr12g0525761 [Helianthus annuus]